MSTAATESPKPEAALQPLQPDGQSVMLRGVSWNQYLCYSDEPENEGVRMYYADGGLLLMTTGPLHETISSLLDKMLFDWAREEGIPVRCLRRWTMRRESREKGLEADECYNVSSLPKVRGRKELDLRVDPPPDLAIEVDVTTHSEHKFEIYSTLGVAELWVWRGDSIQVFRLEDNGYVETERSVELPQFPFAEAAAAITESYEAFREKSGRN